MRLPTCPPRCELPCLTADPGDVIAFLPVGMHVLVHPCRLGEHLPGRRPQLRVVPGVSPLAVVVVQQLQRGVAEGREPR